MTEKTRYGILTITEFLPKIKKKDRRVMAICDCGTIKEEGYLLKNLVNGNSKSCGCLKIKVKVGTRYHRLVITKKLSKGRVEAICDCGTIDTYQLSNITTGATSSCQCYKKEVNIINAKFMNTPEAKEKARQTLATPKVINQRKETCIDRYGFDNPLKNQEIRQKAVDTLFDRHGVTNAYQIPEIREKAIIGSQSDSAQRKRERTSMNRYGYKSMVHCGAVRKKGHAILRQKRGEVPAVKKICEMLSNRGFAFEKEYEIHKDGHLWDIALFKDKKPVLLIDHDGRYYHSLDNDPYHTQQTNYFLDVERFEGLQDNIKIMLLDEIIKEKGMEECVKEIIKTYEMDYDQWITDIFNQCKNINFPYPSYSEKRMLDDFIHLMKIPKKRKYNQKQIPANSIMTHFHHSIYTSRVGKNPSPVMAWDSEKLLLKCIKNRFIYCGNLSSQNIARGFEKSKIAPRVSVFQPSFAKFLLEKFAENAKTVFDPFSGFSGRMLGTIACGKQYIGQDIRQDVIDESIQIINFLKLEKQAKVQQKDSLKKILTDHYDVLFTCPPYGNKELWGDNTNAFAKTDDYVEFCLNNYKADCYIFIIDITEKYKDYIQFEFMNKSHFSNNSEYVLVIDKKQTPTS